MDIRHGFSALRSVRVIGYYTAKDPRSNKQFVVYVIEVTLHESAANSSFLVYRRYSQIAILSSRLHFETSVGLPPKYALQPFPLTEEQLRHRYDGLRQFVEEIFEELKRKACQGEQHETNSTAGLDMQIFNDFLQSHKNRPPPPLEPPLPNWACPTDHCEPYGTPLSSRFSSVSSESLATTSRWTELDEESADSEDYSAVPEPTADPVNASNQLRNDVLQVESQCHALWNCVQAYVQAAQTFAQATAAVENELQRLSQMQLVTLPEQHLITSGLDNQWKNLHENCSKNVIEPLQSLCHSVLPEVKESFWSIGTVFPINRYENERNRLKAQLQSIVLDTKTAFESAHNSFIGSAVHEKKTEEYPLKALDSLDDVNSIETPTHSQSEISQSLTPTHQSASESPVFKMEQFGHTEPQVYVWGRLPDATQPLLRPTKQAIGIGQDITQIACGGDRLLFLTGSGEVFSSNPDEKGQSIETPQLVEQFALDKALHRSIIRFIACGPQHALAIAQQGELYTWGSGEDGRLGHGDIRDRHAPRKVMSLLGEQIIQGSCGGAHTAVVTATNQIYTFGRGKHGRLGLGTNIHFQPSPEPISDVAQWKHVCCGWNFTIALSIDGQVYSWGKQAEGQCGLGYIETDQLRPIVIEALAPYKITCVASGYTHTLAIAESGELFSWGLGEYGQLGKETIYQPVPQIVDVSQCLVMDRVTRVYCGAFHSVATTEKNILLTWGLNVYGACGLGHTINRDIPERLDCFNRGYELVVACGHKFTMVLERMNGTSVDLSVSQYTKSSLEREEDLRKTKKLWRSRILRDWETAKDSALAHTLWRQGIPPSLRSKVWPLAIGNVLKITPDMYQLYRQRANETRLGNLQLPSGREHTVKLIHTDLPRTFPSLKLFDASGPYFDYLREVLETYACYRPDLGYIQGMSYIAALLCLHIPTDRYLCFQCLANIMVHEHLFTFYLLNVELSSDYYVWFDVFFEVELPQLQDHFVRLGIPTSMFLMNWLQTLFLQILPLEIASRVFDCFLLDGVLFLYRTAIAILRIFSKDLLESEFEDALPLLQRHHQYQTTWSENLTEKKLFETIASISTPSHVCIGVEQLVQNVYFYQPGSLATALTPHQQKQRRSRYALNDHLNGIMGGL